MQSPAVCSACGNPLFPDAKFCATCGAPLEAYNEPTTQPEAQRSAPSVCIVCGNELS
ncbi:MAG: double zinc ribbon domain-containing protein, partial [Halobacteriota archaeon]